jgi:hypothetical protein
MNKYLAIDSNQPVCSSKCIVHWNEGGLKEGVSRSVPCIALHPCNNAAGSWAFMNLVKKRSRVDLNGTRCRQTKEYFSI